jgi:hypothetical protein
MASHGVTPQGRSFQCSTPVANTILNVCGIRLLKDETPVTYHTMDTILQDLFLWQDSLTQLL